MASEEQLLLVELVRSVSAMRTETVMQTVKEVLKQPPAIAKDKVGIPDSVPSFQETFGDCLVDHISVATMPLKFM